MRRNRAFSIAIVRTCSIVSAAMQSATAGVIANTILGDVAILSRARQTSAFRAQGTRNVLPA
jgi:hypothetical protein